MNSINTEIPCLTLNKLTDIGSCDIKWDLVNPWRSKRILLATISFNPFVWFRCPNFNSSIELAASDLKSNQSLVYDICRSQLNLIEFILSEVYCWPETLSYSQHSTLLGSRLYLKSNLHWSIRVWVVDWKKVGTWIRVGLWAHRRLVLNYSCPCFYNVVIISTNTWI